MHFNIYCKWSVKYSQTLQLQSQTLQFNCFLLVNKDLCKLINKTVQFHSNLYGSSILLFGIIFKILLNVYRKKKILGEIIFLIIIDLQGLKTVLLNHFPPNNFIWVLCIHLYIETEERCQWQCEDLKTRWKNWNVHTNDFIYRYVAYSLTWYYINRPNCPWMTKWINDKERKKSKGTH